MRAALVQRAHGRLTQAGGSAGDDCPVSLDSHGGEPYTRSALPRAMSQAEHRATAFPDITLETRDGEVQLSDRWRQGPLVVAFMRHFG